MSIDSFDAYSPREIAGRVKDFCVVKAHLRRSVTDKVVAVVFPITAFVAAGFERSIANMYFLPLAMLLGAPIGAADMARNLVPVIAGNLVGGSVLVALVYYVIYIRAERHVVAAGAESAGSASSS